MLVAGALAFGLYSTNVCIRNRSSHRGYTVIARHSFALSLMVLLHLASYARCEQPPERTVVHLIDPRNVALTKNFLRTHYGDDKADIIASRT